jgi:hypothetical protein
MCRKKDHVLLVELLFCPCDRSEKPHILLTDLEYLGSAQRSSRFNFLFKEVNVHGVNGSGNIIDKSPTPFVDA